MHLLGATAWKKECEITSNYFSSYLKFWWHSKTFLKMRSNLVDNKRKAEAGIEQLCSAAIEFFLGKSRTRLVWWFKRTDIWINWSTGKTWPIMRFNLHISKYPKRYQRPLHYLSPLLNRVKPPGFTIRGFSRSDNIQPFLLFSGSDLFSSSENNKWFNSTTSPKKKLYKNLRNPLPLLNFR